jgi:hypothetical protein
MSHIAASAEPHCHRSLALLHRRRAPLPPENRPEAPAPSPAFSVPAPSPSAVGSPPRSARAEPHCHRSLTQKRRHRRPAVAGTIGGPLQSVPQELRHRRIPPPLLPKPQVHHSLMVLGFLFLIRSIGNAMRTMKIRRLCCAEHCSTVELGFFTMVRRVLPFHYIFAM